MSQVGEKLASAGVGAIFLVHGTFVGDDAWGVGRALAPVLGTARTTLETHLKRLADAVMGEAGNYTPEYRAIFQDALTGPSDHRIPVRLFRWSSENHHIGRASAAIQLIAELNDVAAAVPPGCRLLLWGHSHAGNVFALITNLLAAVGRTRAEFFDTAKIFYRLPFVGGISLPVWKQAHDLLRESSRPIDQIKLDFVTFGTPIRYGWDTSGYAKLLHFVNHRPREGLEVFRAPFPVSVREMSLAVNGDYIQQLGIAGTNTAPSIFSFRSWLANLRLGRLLQSGVRRRDLWHNLSHGMRVPEEGTTLLIDYGDAGGNPAHHLAGHAVYTRREWLLYHAEEVCRRFYPAST